jgi:uncharacterized lipoprotein YajG
MQRLKIVFLFLGMFSLSNCVLASQEGEGKNPILSGSVSDAFSKKPVKGVTISVTSSNDRTEKFVTDESGNFSIAKLPKGEVTIVLEKKGYKTYKREKFVVKEGTQLKIKFDISNDKPSEDGNLFHPLFRMMEI